MSTHPTADEALARERPDEPEGPAAAAPREGAESTTAAPRRGTLLAGAGLRKSFQVGDRQLEILHGVDIVLGHGEVVALLGASGAGKSTLLHVLGLLERPTEGTLHLDGIDAWNLPTAARAALRNQRIGFVFQFYHLLPELSALENVLLPAMIAESGFSFRRKRRELLQRAESMLDEFGLGDRLKHRPAQLSGGERQRVALARALFQNPSLLIADEPTGNLDSGTGQKVLDLLFAEQERRGITLLLVTHDERLAERCARSLHMGDGMIIGDSAIPVPV
jgi:lipoprotein-releasing system ATP-binding protein